MNKEQKAAVIDRLAGELREADAIFAIDYRGISVPQAAELRAGLRDAGTRFRVVKNRLTLRAADEAGTDHLKQHLVGPTALAFVQGDVALAAKTISRLGSEWNLLAYKGGLMGGEALDPDSFGSIARLPGRDALNAQFAGIVASPLTGLVRGLGSMIQGLARQLEQIRERGLVSGEPPAPAEEATRSETGGEPDAESKPDPRPSESREETSQEEAPADEDGSLTEDAPGSGETTEGDADLGEDAPEEAGSDGDEASESGDETKEEHA